MHAQSGVGTRPDTPVAAGADAHQPESVPAHGDDAASARGSNRSEWGYLPVTSFRSRRSALSDGQRETWERLWPAIGLPQPDAPELRGPLDVHAWFGRKAPVVLEIGSGSGSSTLAMAMAEPDIDVIAVEIYRRGLAQLLSAIDREQVSNIRLIRGNGVDVLQQLVAPAALSGVRVFLPDPWPKARHHKRRLLQSSTVGLIADRLLPGGVLHAATDHPGYAEQIAQVGDAEPRLCRVNSDAALPISVRRPTTKYETKARHAGSAVAELIWKKL